MHFSVRTLAADMSIDRIVIEASDEADARRQIEARGLHVSVIQPAKSTAFTQRRSRGFSLVLFSQELLVLLDAGLGIVESLDALREKEGNPTTRTVLERLLAGLHEGKRFSSVLAAQPGLFPPLYVGIVRAAEGTGNLTRAMTRFIEYQQRVDVVRGKIVSASIYPLILLAVGAGVSAFLIGYVVPRFADVYQGAGRELPWMSQLLLDWGKFAAHHGVFLITGALCTVALALAGARRMAQAGVISRLVERMPGIGERVRIFGLSRLYLTLGMLSESGIPIVRALETVEPMVPNNLRAALASARRAVEAGRPLSDAFEADGLTTPISVRMLRVGERTGDLGTMLTQSATFYDGEISRWIDRFTRTFEPLLMAAIGLVVGAIVVLLYMPIFDLAGDMS